MDPLTLEELIKMPGMPVWCEELKSYGIVKCDKYGKWKDRPFLYGSWYDQKSGMSVDFEYDIQKRNLKCYRMEGLK